VRASIRKSNHALIYNEELKKIRFQMLNAHNKNRPVKYLESLNNGSKHWYLLKNKQVYSFIRWSTTLEMCPRKKVNYTRKKRAQEKKKEENQLHYHFHVQSQT